MFSFKIIHELVPEKHRKFVRNIHKRVERGKRKKMEGYSNKMVSFLFPIIGPTALSCINETFLQFRSKVKRTHRLTGLF